MKRVVVDASVALKWLFPDREGEAHTTEALALLEDVRTGEAEAIQPVHWLAEVAAVAARFDPGVAREAVPLLWALELPVADSPEVYQAAVGLAADLGQHVFDTLYHAVALETPGACLVTADARYYRKAKEKGRLLFLEDYSSLRRGPLRGRPSPRRGGKDRAPPC